MYDSEYVWMEKTDNTCSLTKNTSDTFSHIAGAQSATRSQVSKDDMCSF